MGGISFGWMALWVPSPEWLCRIQELCDVRVSRVSYFKYIRQQVVLSARNNRKYTIQIVRIFQNI